ncbi:suppressor of fused domain protein [Shewanella zhangzhouensis]|uniref:suppressor of fused domain protein n=1 Tax=Shewanella zhangzhouensis TaxID=2864213 RepID=UPI001C661277|nr:suppressor of fused domain protein [Shewanella zhangzhouensis]QYK06874.1 suppressor of fused domain protein [Shewanella zhangzhouensis]
MSKEENLVSMSGAPIFRYTDGEKEWEAPTGEECIEEISNHIEQYIGEVSMVFHELISDTVHIDVHHVKPTPERPFHTLVTSGMSDLKMSVPENVDSTHYMELMVTLPEYWQIDDESFKDERWYWPVRQLKFLARFPHKFDTWLAWGHTIPNGDPAEAYADNTKLSGAIILPSVNVPEGFSSLEIDNDKVIEFYSIVPLYDEEMKLKLNKGSDLLLDKFDKHGISDIIVTDRKNVAKKRFGLF